MSSPIPKKGKTQKMLSFEEIIKDLIAGKKLTKKEWGDSNEFIFLVNERLSIHHSNQRENEYDHLILKKGDMEGNDWQILTEVKNDS